nr:RNA-directed DNA polymerase, eukaryota [Tanacetum cinerariifolium]
MELKDAAQKSRVNWAIEGDENLKFFHGVINKRRSQLAIRGIFVNGDWYTDPSMVKEAFLDHFTARFKQPSCGRLKLNMSFPNRLSSDQTVISGLISNTQSAFVAHRHILDGPFILNEVLAWCKRRRKQALVFKVDFAKAYDSVR